MAFSEYRIQKKRLLKLVLIGQRIRKIADFAVLKLVGEVFTS